MTVLGHVGRGTAAATPRFSRWACLTHGTQGCSLHTARLGAAASRTQGCSLHTARLGAAASRTQGCSLHTARLGAAARVHGVAGLGAGSGVPSSGERRMTTQAWFQGVSRPYLVRVGVRVLHLSDHVRAYLARRLLSCSHGSRNGLGGETWQDRKRPEAAEAAGAVSCQGFRKLAGLFKLPRRNWRGGWAGRSLAPWALRPQPCAQWWPWGAGGSHPRGVNLRPTAQPGRPCCRKRPMVSSILTSTTSPVRSELTSCAIAAALPRAPTAPGHPERPRSW